MRLTNPPIDISKPMISAISLILVQNRNRRTGKRRTLQIAEVTSAGDPVVLMQYNAQTDRMDTITEPKVTFEKISLYTGMTRQDIQFDIRQKTRILQWLIGKKVKDVDEIGMRMSRYYLGNLQLD